jgi:hypothetical protein
MTFVPLDASNNVPITRFFQQTVPAHPRTPALRIIGTILRDPYYTQSLVYFWDPLAPVATTDQQAVRLRAARLVISTEAGANLGITRISPAGSPVRLAMSANGPAFERQFLATQRRPDAIRCPGGHPRRRGAERSPVVPGHRYPPGRAGRQPRLTAAGRAAPCFARLQPCAGVQDRVAVEPGARDLQRGRQDIRLCPGRRPAPRLVPHALSGQ